jgi:hypothetical protein
MRVIFFSCILDVVVCSSILTGGLVHVLWSMIPAWDESLVFCAFVVFTQPYHALLFIFGAFWDVRNEHTL